MATKPFAFLMDDDLQVRAVFEDFLELVWNRRFFVPAGAFHMRINLNQRNAAEIRKGTLIAVTDDPEIRPIDRVLRVEQVELEMGSEGVSGEVLRVSGRDLSGMLEERLCLPPPGMEADAQSGPVETVMKHFVRVNAAEGAAPSRQVPRLRVAPDRGRGEAVTYEGRYQTVARLLEELSVATRMGWEVTFDAEAGEHVFEVIEPMDRTVGSPRPVLFDTEFETVRSQRYLTTDLERKTFAYVGGKGEGAARPIVHAFLGNGEPIGFERREIFVDARDQTHPDALQLRGRASLAETMAEDAMEAEISQSAASHMVYRRDYDMGDVVTVRNRKWNIELPMRIVGVEHRIQAGTGTVQHVLSLEHPFPTLKDRILAELARMEAGRRI